MIELAFVFLTLYSTSALQCRCSSPLCVDGQCTAVNGGYCYRKWVVSGDEVFGCFVPQDYYLCNATSAYHATACCAGYDSCNVNAPLPPSETGNNVGLPGRPITCLQSNASNPDGGGRCSSPSGYCYLLATKANGSATTQYEQGCTATCDEPLPSPQQGAERSCCSTDLCNAPPSAVEPPPAPLTLYSCYCTDPECGGGGVCSTILGCYADAATGRLGCVSARDPCLVPNRTCCEGRWCNHALRRIGEEAVPPPLPPGGVATTIGATVAATFLVPSPFSHSTHDAASLETRGVTSPQLRYSTPLQALTAVVLLSALVGTLSLAYVCIRIKSRKKPDSQLQQFIETSV